MTRDFTGHRYLPKTRDISLLTDTYPRPGISLITDTYPRPGISLVTDTYP
jgi:hypothetical protein